MRLLRRLATADRLAMICVLHQPELALRYADRVIGLRQGRVVFSGAPSALGPADISTLYESQTA